MNHRGNRSIPTNIRRSNSRSAWKALAAALIIIGAITACLSIRSGVFRRLFESSAISLGLEYPLSGQDPAIVRVVESARQAVRRSPESGDTWGRLGMIYLANGMNRPADACFSRAESLAPMEPRWPYLRAWAVGPADSPQVVAELRRAVKITPSALPAPRLRLAEMLIGRVQFDEAQGLLREVLKAHPNNTRALLASGRLEIARGHFEAGISLVRQAFAAMPALRSAHLLLSQANDGLGRIEDARRERNLADSTPADPFWPDPWLEEVAAYRTGLPIELDRANQLLNAGRAPEAFEILRLALQDHPYSVPALLSMGKALRIKGDSPDAATAFLAVLKLEPQNLYARSELGDLYLHTGRYNEAVACFRDSVRIQPRLASSWLLLGASLQRTGARDEAVSAMRRAIALDPRLPDAHYFLAGLLDQMGRRGDAIDEARAAVKIGGGDKKAQHLLDYLASAASRPATEPAVQ